MATYRFILKNSDAAVELEDNSGELEKNLATITNMLNSSKVVILKSDQGILLLRPTDVLAVNVFNINKETVGKTRVPIDLSNLDLDIHPDTAPIEPKPTQMVFDDIDLDSEFDITDEDSQYIDIEEATKVNEPEPEPAVGLRAGVNKIKETAKSKPVKMDTSPAKETNIPNKIMEDLAKIDSQLEEIS